MSLVDPLPALRAHLDGVEPGVRFVVLNQGQLERITGLDLPPAEWAAKDELDLPEWLVQVGLGGEVVRFVRTGL